MLNDIKFTQSQYQVSYFYHLFIRDNLALSVINPSFDTMEALEKEGWQLMWDSAPNELAAYNYAAEHYNAVPVAICHICEAEVSSLTPATGTYMFMDEPVWFSGRICEACRNASDVKIHTIRGVKP